MTRKRAIRAQERRRLWRKEARARGMTDEVEIERAVWRRQFTNDGLSAEAIEMHLDDYVCESIAKRTGDLGAARRLVFGDGYVTPDDSKYRPDHVPAELRGQARAIGETARAVQRGKTITRWQHKDVAS